MQSQIPSAIERNESLASQLVNLSVVEQHADAGKLRLIAAATPKRLMSLPDLPTVGEAALPGFEANTWFGMLGPAKLPLEVVSKVHADITSIVASQGFREQHFTKLGLEPVRMTSEQFAQKITIQKAHLRGD